MQVILGIYLEILMSSSVAFFFSSLSTLSKAHKFSSFSEPCHHPCTGAYYDRETSQRDPLDEGNIDIDQNPSVGGPQYKPIWQRSTYLFKWSVLCWVVTLINIGNKTMGQTLAVLFVFGTSGQSNMNGTGSCRRRKSLEWRKQAYFPKRKGTWTPGSEFSIIFL